MNKIPMKCAYCGSENVRQFGGCTQEECFYTCLDCDMLSDYTSGINSGGPHLIKKNCGSNREQLKIRGKETMTCKEHQGGKKKMTPDAKSLERHLEDTLEKARALHKEPITHQPHRYIELREAILALYNKAALSRSDEL